MVSLTSYIDRDNAKILEEESRLARVEDTMLLGNVRIEEHIRIC